MPYEKQSLWLQLSIPLAGALLANICVGAQLPNDRCDGATLLQSGVPVILSTADATDATDPEPTCGAAFGSGVWFRFTPASNGLVRVSTCGSTFDTVLQVYTGNCNSLTPMTGACNDNEGPSCAELQASVQFLGAGGATYWILAGGASQAKGTLHIVANLMNALSNDRCSGATPLQAGVPYAMSTVDATDTDDPVPVCASAFGGVWFSFTPASDGMVRVSTCGSDFATVVQLYSGDCFALTPMAGGCNDFSGSACAGFQASVQFLGSAGTTYRILAGGYGGARGRLNILAESFPSLINDQCQGALTLQPGVSIAMSTTNATATGDPLPTCQTNFGAGVWFKFTPANDGIVTLSTCGSDFDTVLQVYSGSCGTLIPVASGCNDYSGPACPSPLSAVLQFPGIGGQTYWILAGGALGARGTLSMVADPPPPANDACSGSITLQPGVPFIIDTFLAGNGSDPAPTCQPNFGHGVWFNLTLGNSGQVTVSTCGTGFDTVLQVYTGDCNALVPVAGGCNDDQGPACGGSRASVRFQGTGGVTYRILVGGYGGALGLINIVADFPFSSPTINISLEAGSAFLLQINGVPRWTYLLQTSTNLFNWLDLTPVTMGADGRFNFWHTNQLNPRARFFRLRTP